MRCPSKYPSLEPSLTTRHTITRQSRLRSDYVRFCQVLKWPCFNPRSFPRPRTGGRLWRISRRLGILLWICRIGRWSRWSRWIRRLHAIRGIEHLAGGTHVDSWELILFLDPFFWDILLEVMKVSFKKTKECYSELDLSIGSGDEVQQEKFLS